MAYVELGQDNGGILLNLSEGGFAVQSALELTSHEFPEFRFQVPAFHGWLKASGRVVWMSESKKEAGIQFTELPGDARREIRKWVSAEGDVPEARERIQVHKESQEPSKQIFDTPYRGGGGADQQASGYTTQANLERAEREREQTTRKETVGAAVSEPPLQDFRFTEYSMFTPDLEKEEVWTEPARHRGKLGGALLVILVAGLFFALGATVGRGTMDQWISYLGDWTWNQPSAPRVTPPVPPEAAGGAGAADRKTEDRKEAKIAADEKIKAEEDAGATSGTAGDSDAGKANNQNKDEDALASKTEAASGSAAKNGNAVGSAASSAMAAGTKERGPRRPTENAVPRNSRDVEVAPDGPAIEHSILVNAPGPGSRPFVVNFPGEAVSASASIAISARRTLEVLPTASGRSERVVIGKLISHSEPFYPMEARTRGIQGIVELRARVGRTGQIISVTPITGPGLLMSAAVTAVREWRYEPTFVNGDPAETLADITIVFRLP